MNTQQPNSSWDTPPKDTLILLELLSISKIGYVTILMEYENEP